MATCDPLDGLKDGIISNVAACRESAAINIDWKALGSLSLPLLFASGALGAQSP
jgi:hypothetical protein